MKALVVSLALLAGCEQPRTQMMIGVVTDIKAPNLIDGAQLVVTRAKDGFIEQQVDWDISGVPNMPFNLPGSYGIYSDGSEIQLDIVLRGTKGGQPVVDRRAVLNLVEGKTLFFRMSLTAGCAAKTDCLPTQSCVEGVCRDVNVNPLQLPDFEPALVGELTCNSGSAFIDTSTGAPLPLSADADQCPAHLCLEGTCLKPPPPEEGTRTVTGTQFTTFVQAAKTTNVPADLSMVTPRALVPNEDGSFTTITGTGSAEGTFVIPEVPKGTYYLNVGNQYFITHASNFDLTAAVSGRPDTVLPAQPATTTLNFQNVSGLDPWQDNDELELMAPDADLWMFDADSATVAPLPVGTTTLANFAITHEEIASFIGKAPLVRNDPFFALQLRAKQAPSGLGYKAATKLFAASPFTQTDGGTTNLTGTFTAIPQTNMTAGATFGGAAWDMLTGFNGTNYTALHPTAIAFPGFDFYSLVIHGQVGGSSFGRVGATADYLVSALPHGTTSTLGDLQFGIPALPGSWATIVDVGTNTTYRIQLPGTTRAARVFVGMGQTTLYSALTTAFFAPQMGPSRNLRIDGQDAFGTLGAGISTTPTISWLAPTIGKPMKYTMSIFRFVASGSNTVRQLVATFHTTDTSVVVPPGVLTLGETLVVNLTADTTPNPEAPFRGRFPGARSTIASSVFQPTVAGGTGGGGGAMADAGTSGPACNPGNCTGCCSGGSVCIPPASQNNAQCGANGNQCVGCATGMSCNAGMCQ